MRKERASAQKPEEDTPEREQARGEYLEELRRRGDQEIQRRMEKTAADWFAEGRAAEAAYPGFRLENECRDPKFLRLLEAGLDMTSAFEALHHREILERAVEYTARSVTESLVENLRSRRGRPLENGASGRSGAVIRPDVSRMSRKYREELERRAMRGERISF